MSAREITPDEAAAVADHLHRARRAMADADAFTQDQVDRLCRAVAWAAGNL